MPLQQIQLDQSIYNKQKPKWGAGRQPQRSAVSEALTPQQGPTGGGLAAEQRLAPNRWVEIQREEWAKEDKLKKAERDRKVEEAQEMGMRIRDAYEKEKERGRAQSAKVEADVEAMAMEAYKFAVDEELDDASRQNILRALKAKPKAYDFLMKKGLIMADGSDFVRKAGEPAEAPSWSIQEGFLVDKTSGIFYEMPEKEADKFDPTQIQELTDSQDNKYFMYKGKVLTPSTKPQVGRYQLTSEGILDTATQTMDTTFKKGASDEENAKDIIDSGLKFGIDINKATNNKTTVEEGAFIYFRKLGFSVEESTAMSKMEEMPKEKKESLITRMKNMFGKPIPTTTVTGAGKGAYREDAVTALIPLMEGLESITAVHYDQWTKQGATKEEIDEAFKRAKGEK